MKKLTIGILAHVDAGKTTLSEALLYTSGNIRKLGRVDKRDAFLDTYTLEKERGITIFSKQAVLNTADTSINITNIEDNITSVTIYFVRESLSNIKKIPTAAARAHMKEKSHRYL